MAARVVAPEDARFHPVANQFGQTRNQHFFFEDPDGPQGYLVDMPANNDVRPHFHQVDQFQLFLGVAGATYLRSPIRPGTVVVHYADGCATYGPFATGAEPMQFYTLRAQSDQTIGYMPEDRDKLVRKGRRNLHGEAEVTEGRGTAAGAVEQVALIDEDVDGMRSYLLRIGPGAEIEVPVGDAGGQYCCVVGGAAIHAGTTYGVKALAWVPRGGAPLAVATGPDVGVELVVMDLPFPPTSDGEEARRD